MTRRFSCVCGNRLVSPAHLVGRRVRCPVCGGAVIVPDAGTEETAQRTISKVAIISPAAGAVTFRCACGNPLQARAERAGSLAKCPACGGTVSIPQSSVGVPGPAAGVATKPRLDRGVGALAAFLDPEDGDDEPVEEERRVDPVRKKPRPLILAALAVAGLLCVGSGSTALYRWWKNTTPGTDQLVQQDGALPPLALLGRPAPPTAGFPGSAAPPGLGLSSPVQMAGVPDAREQQLPEHIELPDGKPEEADALIPRKVVGFVSVPVAAWWNDATRKHLSWFSLANFAREALIPGFFLDQVQRAVYVVPEPQLPSRWLIIVTAKPYDAVKFLGWHGVFPGDAIVTVRRDGRTVYIVHAGTRAERAFYFHSKRVLVELTGPSLEYFFQNPPAPNTPPQDYERLVAVAPVPDLFRSLQPLVPQDCRPLLDARQATLTAELGDAARLGLSFRYANEVQAAEAAKAAPAARAWGRDLLQQYRRGLLADGMSDVPESVRLLEQAWQELSFHQKEATVEARWQLQDGTRAVVQGLLVPWLERSRRDQVREINGRKMRGLLMALTKYLERNNRWPPPATSKDAKPLLSWRVELLPFLGPRSESLYSEFHLNEAWDSPHNKKLIARMPRIFEPAWPTGKVGETVFQVFVGPGTPFSGAGPLGPHFLGGSTGNTILIAEAADGVPWTKPADLPYAPDRPLPRLGGQVPGEFLAAMADGTVRSVPRNAKEASVRAMIAGTGAVPQAGAVDR